MFGVNFYFLTTIFLPFFASKIFPKEVKLFLIYKPTRQQYPTKNSIFPIVDHMGERPHKCSHCGETFKHLIVLKRHVNVVHLKIKETCSMCGNQYTDRKSLQKHQRIHHPGMYTQFVKLAFFNRGLFFQKRGHKDPKAGPKDKNNQNNVFSDQRIEFLLLTYIELLFNFKIITK